MCDCNLTLVGVVSLASAGSFDFVGKDRDPARLEKTTGATGKPVELSENDWPTLRANNTRNAFSRVTVPNQTKLLWTHPSTTKSVTTVSSAGG